jgi:Major capsid protein Gp23
MELDRNELLKRWEKLLVGISDQSLAYQTARLMENQAKAFLKEKLNEDAVTPGTTTVGKLGTYQKWALPMIRRIYPELMFNKIGATQAMDGPVSQIFYMGNSRVYGGDVQTMYSMMQITPRNLVAKPIGSVSGPGVAGTWSHDGNGNYVGGNPAEHATVSGSFDLSNVLRADRGSPSTTMGGKLASWPTATTTLGWSVSSAERLRGSGIPEVTLHIQKQTVQARERKMRALWTIEAAQDLKAYHNLDLESELTELLSKEMNLEIDRELIEDIRMIAYGFESQQGNPFGGWYLRSLFNGGADDFLELGGVGPDGNTFTPGNFTYDWKAGVDGSVNGFSTLRAETGPNTSGSNVYVMDMARFLNTSTNFAPQHLGHVYSNVLALINFASNDIYKTTLRGPGTVLITSPLIATLLEVAAKLEGGAPAESSPTNMEGKSISYKGKFMGKFDLIIDPMFPEDEIIVAYKGAGSMDAGFFYCPYIPITALDKVTDPDNFQPRKGILTRYGKVAIQPASRFFRVIRLVGTTSSFITREIFRNDKYFGATASY